MAIQVLGSDGTTVAAIDPGHDAQRVSIRPMRVTAWSSIAAATGLVTTLAAGAPVFSFRYTGVRVLLVRRVAIQWINTAAFTTSQRLEWGLYVARTFTTFDTGGLPLSAGSGRHRSTLATPAVEARIAMTTALTAGTRTLDTHPLGIAPMFSYAAGATLPQTHLLSHDSGDHPLALVQNEGFIVSNMLLMGAAGVGVLYAQVEFSEAESF